MVNNSGLRKEDKETGEFSINSDLFKEYLQTYAQHAGNKKTD